MRLRTNYTWIFTVSAPVKESALRVSLLQSKYDAIPRGYSISYDNIMPKIQVSKRDFYFKMAIGDGDSSSDDSNSSTLSTTINNNGNNNISNSSSNYIEISAEIFSWYNLSDRINISEYRQNEWNTYITSAVVNGLNGIFRNGQDLLSSSVQVNSWYHNNDEFKTFESCIVNNKLSIESQKTLDVSATNCQLNIKTVNSTINSKHSMYQSYTVIVYKSNINYENAKEWFWSFICDEYILNNKEKEYNIDDCKKRVEKFLNNKKNFTQAFEDSLHSSLGGNSNGNETVENAILVDYYVNAFRVADKDKFLQFSSNVEIFFGYYCLFFVFVCMIVKLHSICIVADSIEIIGILLFGIYYLDFISDIIFSIWLFRLGNYISFAICLLFLCLPWIFNMYKLFSIKLVWTIDATINENIIEWLEKWWYVLLGLTMITGCAFGMVEIVNVKLNNND